MGRTKNRLNKKSVQARIAEMAVGDVLYIETSSAKYDQVQREWNLPKARRVEATRDFVMECSLLQAIRVGKLAEPIILVRVERKA